ncbi:hypothetical protein [Desulfococcus sp.]|uniref:hypothetical protein n=1 Tax=Desulfococcus sp. TaxID=2025834 RepID=UPI0035934F09
MLRQILATFVILAAAAAWWFPAPLLLRTELIHWEKLYEARYAPSGFRGARKPFFQSVSKPQPLTQFIASRTAGQVVTGTDPAWGGIFSRLEANLAQKGAAVSFVDPKVYPFSVLPGTSRYLEWRDAEGIRYLEYQVIPAKDFESHHIPPEIEFPYRQHWALLLAGGAGAMLFGFVRGGTAGLVAGSSAGKGMRWSAVLALLFAGAILWPFLYQNVGSGFSYASILMGGLFLIGALLGVWLFGLQAALLRRMIGGGCLAHFTYAPEEWTRFVEWNFGEEASEKMALWWLIFAISLVIGLGFMAVMRDGASVWVFGVLMGLMAFLWILAVLMPRLACRRHLRRTGEVYIAKDGIYLNGSVHSWGTLGARLDSVEFNTKPLPHLHVVYSYWMVAGRSLHVTRNCVNVRVPVPAGQESAGRDVAKQLQEPA